MRSYSTYEAKAKFSELLRRVRERGETFVVSYHGRPVAEIRPVQDPKDEQLEDRLARLRASGVITAPAGPTGQAPRRVARRPGALRRFLAEREE